MKRQHVRKTGAHLIVIAMLVMVAGGCAISPKQPDNVRNVMCGAKQIEWDVAPEADVSSFNCELGQKGMDPALIVTMDLKNVADKPLRFKVHVFLEDMDKASGHLVPRKGEPPVVTPGAVEKVNIPFIKTDAMSTRMTVVVRAMGE
jgi:hypothetical protein